MIHANIAIDFLKIVISTSVIGSAQFEDGELQELFNKHSTQTQKRLAGQIGIIQLGIPKRLHTMGKIQKVGRWVPHELSEHKLGQRMKNHRHLLSNKKST